MNALKVIAEAAQATGYRAESIFRDFSFADVLDPSNPTRQVPLAAFTHTPPSYRSAALAAVPASSGETVSLVRTNRALGAPLLFVIDQDHLSLWQVCDGAPRRLNEHVPVHQVPDLFKAHRKDWHPDAIHRAKSLAMVDHSYQLDFVDLGLLPALEGQIHAKLDRLLVDMLKAADEAKADNPLDPHLLFRCVFRLLAAKVLCDRDHPSVQSLDTDDLPSMLKHIESFYSLSPEQPTPGPAVLPPLNAAWDRLRRGINFSNISSDDLAFVYENTLVTPDTRLKFGTHSTPRQLAEYAVSRLGLHHHPFDELQIYEPFAGAGIFLLSALRHLRDLLPADWNDAERHDFLVNHISGDEIDEFACEVATLSLILADYPNQNGWRISQSDLFSRDKLGSRLSTSNIVLCNPPFQDFSEEDRLHYGTSLTQHSKPIEVMNAVLEAKPRALGLVLPRAFILHRKFARQRQLLEQGYLDIELVELPDRIFSASGIESALVIAKNPRNKEARPFTALRSTVVSDSDRTAFLRSGQITTTRCTERPFPQPQQHPLWIPPISELWEYLSQSPSLGDFLTIHRGIEWQSRQQDAWAPNRRSGYRRGLHSARHTRQYLMPPTVWLDCHKDRLRGNAFQLPWDAPKLVTNAARVSRSAWRIGAILDTSGLICSQRYMSFWPRTNTDVESLHAFSALLNGPLASAFLAVHSPEKGIRISAVRRIPVPIALPDKLTGLVKEYVKCLHHQGLTFERDKRLNALLLEIDATVLRAYNLPPRLERELLNFFPPNGRPVAHRWTHWNGPESVPGLTLAERLSTRYRHDGAVREVFPPLPSEEADGIRAYWK